VPAIEHSMIVTIWHMLTNGTIFEDLGSDHFQRTVTQGSSVGRRRAHEGHNPLCFTGLLNSRDRALLTLDRELDATNPPTSPVGTAWHLLQS
jgi:hypothetical protein